MVEPRLELSSLILKQINKNQTDLLLQCTALGRGVGYERVCKDKSSTSVEFSILIIKLYPQSWSSSPPFSYCSFSCLCGLWWHCGGEVPVEHIWIVGRGQDANKVCFHGTWSALDIKIRSNTGLFLCSLREGIEKVFLFKMFCDNFIQSYPLLYQY